MHLEDGLLRSWLDGEESPDSSRAVAAHLAECSICASRVEQIKTISSLTQNQLSSLTPDPAVSFSAHEALEKHFTRRKESTFMKNLIKKPAAIAAILVLLFAASMLFSPVRAMASDFLGLFRVQQVKVINFDAAILGQLDQNLQGNNEQIRQIFEENVNKAQKGDYTLAENPQIAAELAGFTPRLPADSQEKPVGVMSAQLYEISIDTELWNTILAGIGDEVSLLPAELNGKTITVDIPASITAGIGDCSSLPADTVPQPDPALLRDCILLVEMPSPVVKTPDGLDVPRMAESMLVVLGMSPDEARTFSQSTDWATTLVLPIPSGEGVTNQEVNIDGVAATLMTHDNSPEYTMFWVKDGLLYGIIGSGDPQEALDLGSSLTQ